MNESRVVAIDVDCTAGCGQGGLAGDCGCGPRPGLLLLLEALKALGFQVVLWSAGGAKHARLTAEQGGYAEKIDGFYRKPEFTKMNANSARDVLGFVPALTIDDDPSEALAGVPFVAVEPWWGKHNVVILGASDSHRSETG